MIKRWLKKRSLPKFNIMESKDHIPDYQQFPSEFLSDGDMYHLFMSNHLMMARMIGGSKTGYMEMHPDNKVVFNANILIPSKGKIWHGDLDITRDKENLQNVAKALEEDLYILREHDARWGNEEKPTKHLLPLAVEIIKCEENGDNSRSTERGLFDQEQPE
jgi:hypothetical protein